MYPASDWSVLCSEPSWISARLRSHYRIGLPRAVGVTSVRMRREDRSSIIVSSSRRPRRARVIGYVINSLLGFALFLCLRLAAVPSSRPTGRRSAVAQGAVKAGRRASLASCPAVPRPRLDGPEHGARIKQVGAPPHRSSRTRRCAPCGEPPRRCGRACWRARWRARCDAGASSPPRSRSRAHSAANALARS